MTWPDQKEAKLKDVKLKDGELTFSAERELMDMKITIEYKLKVDGDKLKGKARGGRRGREAGVRHRGQAGEEVTAGRSPAGPGGLLPLVRPLDFHPPDADGGDDRRTGVQGLPLRAGGSGG